MNKLFDVANEYLERSDWHDMAMLKICVCAIGVLIGLKVPREKKAWVAAGAFAAFLCTYVPLMSKFFVVCHDLGQLENTGEE